ncbi:serine hydrolase [Tsukamurella paurometabola]|uniref:Serine hydrolase n=1 Tax=Tsukamurella paurometabola TaxID=2061 RepID=A0ABS5NCY8_TSUPA|nr:serine hydrolase [Tsukamurella paurometabola]MBS4102146.1 serine hydrolase [Tsukamurella paurometabola]
MRRTLITVVAAAIVAAIPAPAASAAPCAPAPAADTSTVAGWTGYLAQHRGDVALVVDDGRGGTVAHRADAAMPTASMLKLIHLAALTGRAGAGRIDLNERIRVADWQKWYVDHEGTPVDGGAHIKALEYLGIPATKGVPNDPSGSVSLHQLADVMIRFSDSAAPDAIRARLGDEALREVMTRYGMPGPVPSLKELYQRITDSGAATEQQAYAAIDRTYAAPAASFARLIGDLGTGRFGPGSEAARRFLEFQDAAPAGLTALGFKGGSLFGVLTEAFEGRRADGSVTVGVLMVRRASAQDVRKDAEAGMPHQQLLVQAMTDEGTRTRVACALRS